MKKGEVFWLTGLPCSGKTAVANELKKHIDCIILDGDVVRKTISVDLGFSIDDREKHLIRMAYIARWLSDNGINVVCAFVSPYREQRARVRSIIGTKSIEIHLDASVETCESRDVKGMWAKARKGEILEFTGVSASYEAPQSPDITCYTDSESVQESVSKILKYINDHRGAALYIGRWQPLHTGHKHIIRNNLNKGIPVVIAIRFMLQDEKNPHSAETIRSTLLEEYKDEDVEVIIIPNISSINYGRNVGYAINEHEVPDGIASISSSKIREGYKENDKK